MHGALNGLNLVGASQYSLCILDFSLVFTLYYLSNTQSFQQNRHIIFHAHVAPKLLVDRQTGGQTDTQINYCNPRCACAPRVNNTTTEGIPHFAASPYTESANAGTFTCRFKCHSVYLHVHVHVHVYMCLLLSFISHLKTCIHVYVVQNYAPALTYMNNHVYRNTF